jgi:hypothetical protein
MALEKRFGAMPISHTDMIVLGQVNLKFSKFPTEFWSLLPIIIANIIWNTLVGDLCGEGLDH